MSYLNHVLKLIFYLSLIIAVIIEFYVESRGSGQACQKGTKNSGRLLSIAIVCAVILGFFSENRILPIDNDFDLSLSAKLIISLLFVWTGIILRIWSLLALGKFFRPIISLQANHKIIKCGPYKHIRHPSYLAILLIFIGLIWYWNSWLGFVALLLVYLSYTQRINYEEKFLCQYFGDEYKEYIKKTKKLLPRLY